MSIASSKRYAQAIFQIASEEKELDNWSKDLRSMVQLIDQADLLTYLTAKRIPLAEKDEIIKDQLPGVGQLARNLLSILVARDGIKQLSEIVIEYERFVDAHKGVARGDVKTAVKISPKLIEEISTMLEGVIGNKVSINTSLDSEIIGGFVAKVGDKLIDASTRTRLDNIKRSIVSSAS